MNGSTWVCSLQRLAAGVVLIPADDTFETSNAEDDMVDD